MAYIGRGQFTDDSIVDKGLQTSMDPLTISAQVARLFHMANNFSDSSKYMVRVFLPLIAVSILILGSGIVRRI